jgi:hypothetical protein
LLTEGGIVAATLTAPTDALTGLTLYIAPNCEWLPLDEPDKADVHHGNHPCRDPRLKTLAGLALRNNQLQLTERTLHNEGPKRYHRWYKQSVITEDESDIFAQVVFANAGVIPEEVIDLSGDEPLRRYATREEYDFLRTPSDDNPFGYRYIFTRYEPIRDFMRAHAVKQNLSHISNTRIDEFLHTPDRDRRIKLGQFFLMNAAAVASDRVRERYSHLWRLGRLHPAMPPEAPLLVFDKLGFRTKEGQPREELLQGLSRRLLALAA